MATHASRMAAGSIPACAGEAGGRWLRAVRVWVYPRVCGGSGRAFSASGKFLGLSPRVRGKRCGVS